MADVTGLIAILHVIPVLKLLLKGVCVCVCVCVQVTTVTKVVTTRQVQESPYGLSPGYAAPASPAASGAYHPHSPVGGSPRGHEPQLTPTRSDAGLHGNLPDDSYHGFSPMHDGLDSARSQNYDSFDQQFPYR